MFALSGILSRRLRKIFGSDVADWPTHREPEAIRTMPEEHYTGRGLSAPYRNVGRHRKDSL